MRKQEELIVATVGSGKGKCEGGEAGDLDVP